MTSESGNGDGPKKVPVWSLSIRLFHWFLVLSVSIGWYLGYFRDFSNINWHFYLGYVVGGLLLVRVLLGIAGKTTERFSSLLWSPTATLRYAATITQRNPSRFWGHSPLGSLSVIALLLSLCVQVITGLFAEDDALFSSGPLSSYLSGSMTVKMTAVHYYNSRVLIALVGLHLLAIAFYLLWKRENLTGAMVTGRKFVDERTQKPSGRG